MMIDFQNFVLEISKAMNQKQFEANLQLQSIIQDEAALNPIQKLEEINKSAQLIIATKNQNALQEFANYFNSPQDLQEEFSQNEKQKQINKSQNIYEVQNKQSKDQIKSKNLHNHQIESNEKIGITLKQKYSKQQALLEKKIKQKENSSQSASQKEDLAVQFSKSINSDANNYNGNNHNEVSKFQIYKNQLKTYEELDKYNNHQPNLKNINNINQHSSNQQTQKGHHYYQNLNAIQKSRNIVQELEQMRMKQKEKERLTVKKSQLKKSKIRRIFKMNPQIQKKNQELRKNQAQEKMKANIVFLDSIKSQGRKQASPSYKEFNNFDSKDMNNLGNSLRMENKKRLEKLGFSDRSRMKISSTHLETLQPTPSWNFLPPIQKNSSLRPKPYSIYHINQKSNQIFYNKLQKSQ